MPDENEKHPFKSVLSLDPLLVFWENSVATACHHTAEMFEVFKQRMNETPELQGEIEDLSILEKHHDLLIPLMTVVFPAASWESDVVGALTPFHSAAFYCSPEFKRLLVADDGSLKGNLRQDQGSSESSRLLRAYFLILEKIYGIRQGMETPIIRVVPDPATGLSRYFRFTPDLRFVDVIPLEKPRVLSQKDRTTIKENITDSEVLAQFIPPDKFKFRGFTVIHAMDVTESEVISALEKDLIDQESIFSNQGFERVQERLRILFRRPDLMAGMGALLGDKILVVSGGCHSDANCIFRNSNHIPMAAFEGSVWLRAAEQGHIVRIPDLEAEPELTPAEQQALEAGIKSMIISPLFYQGETIGTLHVKSPHVNELGSVDEMLIKQIAPLFSVALKRGLDEMNNEVQSIIKQKCTAVHPSVEWRFRKAAFSHMDRLRTGQPSELEPIVFKSVIPFYGQSDIRGSSEGRNKGIQADLIEQLSLAREVMKWAENARPWPLLQELKYRIDKRIEAISSDVASGDEALITHFIVNEVESTFEDLSGLGPRVVRAVENYRKAIDPNLGVVFRKRKEFEESVSLLNERLSAHLEKEQAEAQGIFPHYFEKHQTDGVDYVIYMGGSMMENGKLSDFHVKNLGLWQMIVACGMARLTELAKAELNVPLDTCHLILVNHTPISIRFRYDEKRFDVDGAYDVRHEIVKSRIDKAVIKGSHERLTQPGRIAVVYSHPNEEEEIRRHIEFLQVRESLLNDLEFLELEDLPGVKGLKALRIGANLEAEAMGHMANRGYG